MRTPILLTGLGVGAGLMYLLDPQAGRRRRAIVRDKIVRGARQSIDAADVVARDLRNRTFGLAAETRGRLGEGPVDDRALAERVRAELGRVCSHPRAVAVSARGGRVTLSGPILAAERDRTRAWVAAVPGVTDVEDRLQAHERPDGVPALQGGVPRRVRWALMQANWSPATRFLVGTAGLGLAATGLAARGALGAVSGLAGLGLLARGLTNLETRRLLGLGRGCPAVAIRKSFNIDAGVDRVYAFWRDFTRFPHFMSYVRDVRDLGGGRSRWVVAGPAGVPVEWEALITEDVPNEVIAWRTVPGSSVEHHGLVRFRPNRAGGTRLDIQLAYTPPAGAIGHGVAGLLGANAKNRMESDLVRVKTLLETGRPAHDAAGREFSAR